MTESAAKETRVLGIGEYEARWINRSWLVRLTAHGILPCSNYTAQLEQRPERILPAAWDMVFYVQPVCQKAIRPFHLEVIVHGASAGDSITVHDARGEQELPILPAWEAEKAQEPDRMFGCDAFCVYAVLSGTGRGHVGCIIVPCGSILPAIYYRAFGPASRDDCAKFIETNCIEMPASEAERSGEIPWPLIE